MTLFRNRIIHTTLITFTHFLIIFVLLLKENKFLKKFGSYPFLVNTSREEYIVFFLTHGLMWNEERPEWDFPRPPVRRYPTRFAFIVVDLFASIPCTDHIQSFLCNIIIPCTWKGVRRVQLKIDYIYGVCL